MACARVRDLFRQNNRAFRLKARQFHIRYQPASQRVNGGLFLALAGLNIEFHERSIEQIQARVTRANPNVVFAQHNFGAHSLLWHTGPRLSIGIYTYCATRRKKAPDSAGAF